MQPQDPSRHRPLAAVLAALIVAATVLTLAPPASAAPSNDNLFAAVVITGEQADLTGSTAGATRQSGEPFHAGTGGNSIWYRWMPPTTAWTTIDTCGSTANNVVAVYTGPNVTALTEVASSAYPGDLQSCAGQIHGAVHFLATAGVNYAIAVDSFFGSTGDIQLHLNAPPANDAFASPRVIPSHFEWITTIDKTGWTRYATDEPGEPVHAGTGSASVWMDWHGQGNGPVTIDTCGSAFDTTLAVYQGTAVNALTEVASNDDDPAATCGTDKSRVSFNATIGQDYRIALAGHLGATGEYTVHLDGSQLTLPNDNFADATALTGTSARVVSNNSLATQEPGENQWFGDREGGATIWFRWTAPTTEAYEIDTCDPETSAELQSVLAVFTGSAVDHLTALASNSAARGTSRCVGTDHSSVIFEAVAGTTYSIQVGGVWNRGLMPPQVGNLAVTLFQANRPANDDFDFAKPITGSSLTVSESTAGARSEPGEMAHAGAPAAASVWFNWTAMLNTRARITTCGSSYDTRMGVYRGEYLAELVELAANDDAGATDCPAGATASTVVLNASAGSRYRIAVDGKAGATGSLVLNIQQDDPPYTGWQRLGSAYDPLPNLALEIHAVALPGGDRLLWWNEIDTGLADNHVKARRVAADGTVGPVVNLTGTASMVGYDLITLPDGRLALLTLKIDNLLEGSVDLRLYGPDLVQQGAPVAITGTVIVPDGPTMVVAADGTLTVAWADATALNDFGAAGYVVRYRRMAPNGTLGPVVNLSETNATSNPPDADDSVHIGIAPNGTVTAVWQWRPDSNPFSNPQIQMRRIAADGTLSPVTTLDANGVFPKVAVAPDGTAVVTWGDGDYLDENHPLLATRVRPDGTMTAVQQLDEGPVNNQHFNIIDPQIAMSSTGRAFVVWQRAGYENSGFVSNVRGRSIEVDGTTGPLLQLSNESRALTNWLSFARAAFDRWGNVTTSWGLISDDQAFYTAQARRVAADGTLGPIADLTRYPESGLATGLVIDAAGVPFAGGLRAGGITDIRVDAYELPVADLSVSGTGTGARTATFTVRNDGPRASGGDAQHPVSVRLDPPTGLTVTAASGDGWTCTTGATATCTRTTAIASGATAPAIAVSYGTGPAPATQGTATVSAGLVLDPNPANNANGVTLVPLCAGRPATIVGSGTITGTGGNDVIVGSAGVDTIDGGNGNDVICAGAGKDSVKGGNGDDTLAEADDTGSDVLDGGNGTDTVTYLGRAAGVKVSLDGTANDGETNEGDNVKAVESVVGTNAADVLSGSSGTDRLSGMGGDDQVNGQGGDDLLSGGAGRDTVSGGAGNDAIDESDGTGADVLDGGAGTDVVTYLGRTAGVTVSLDGAANDGEAGEGDNLKAVESVVGTDQADVITGSDGADVLVGLGGNDVLRGLKGNDLLIGGAGSDVLDGGPGVDVAVPDLGDTLISVP